MNRYIKILVLVVSVVLFAVTGCKKDDVGLPALSRTNLLLNEKGKPIITETSAELGCIIYTDGGAPIKEVGVLWQLKTTKPITEMQFPELESNAANKVIGKIVDGSFQATAVVNGFTVKDTAYIVRMYAINADNKIGYSYPNRLSNNLEDY